MNEEKLFQDIDRKYLSTSAFSFIVRKFSWKIKFSITFIVICFVGLVAFLIFNKKETYIVKRVAISTKTMNEKIRFNCVKLKEYMALKNKKTFLNKENITKQFEILNIRKASIINGVYIFTKNNKENFECGKPVGLIISDKKTHEISFQFEHDSIINEDELTISFVKNSFEMKNLIIEKTIKTSNLHIYKIRSNIELEPVEFAHLLVGKIEVKIKTGEERMLYNILSKTF